MSSLQFFLNGVPMPPPAEWQQMELQINFDNDNPSATLQTSQFTFEGTAARFINNWISLNGIFQGIPFKITDCNTLTVLDGCLDLAADEARYECDRVVVPVRDNGLRDYLDDRAKSFRFATLADLPATAPGAITTNDYLAVPYCINDIPDYVQVVIVSLSIYSITKETIQVVKDIGDLIADLANPVTTANAIVQAALLLVYLTALIVAMINLIQQFIDNIIQVRKHKLAMHCRTLFQRGCAYLGLSFQSSIFATNSVFYNAAIIPRKVSDYDRANFINRLREYDELQTPAESYGYYDGTFAEFINDMELVFNAKARVVAGVLRFERFDYWNISTPYTLPNVDTEPFMYNASELAANYLFSWQLDAQDQNTYDEFIGTNCQMQASVTSVLNQKNILLTNLTEVRPGLALAKRKEVLNRVELLLDSAISLLTNLANAITAAINAVLSVLPGNIQIPPLPGNLINQRVGWLRLSSDFIGVPKFVILDGSNNIDANNHLYTSAEYLMQNYHSASFPLQNQWLLYKDQEVPFCCEDYSYLRQSNGMRTFDNRFAKAITIRWQMGANIAKMDYRVKPIGGRYDNNITETLIVNRN
jgi:hypothetical protein